MRTVSAALKVVYREEPKRIVRDFARELLLSVRPSGPPFDPRDYANHFGISVVSKKIAADGLLDYENGPTIYLNTTNQPIGLRQQRRLNFTLAHEIGHFVLRKKLEGGPLDNAPFGKNADEERLCDAFSAELLMPGYVLRVLGCNRREPKEILRLCDTFNVSLETALCRVCQRGIKDAAVAIIWRRRRGQWRTHWATETILRSAYLCANGKTTVERAASVSSLDITGRDDIIIGGRRARCQSVSRQLDERHMVLTIFNRTRALDALLQEQAEKYQRETAFT